MNCIEFRRQVGTAPRTQSDELLAHRQSCPTCARLADEMQSMDSVLEQAFKVDVPASLSEPAALLAGVRQGGAAQRFHRAWYALAASVLVGVGLVTGLWLGQTSSDLPAELIAHVLHEPESLNPDLPIVEFSRVSNILERGRVSLLGDIGDVRYAGLCMFRGNSVAHLVVRGERGPITVMLLPDERVSETMAFNEEGFQGVIVPTRRGSIAIIGDPDELLGSVREQFSRSVEFSI